MTTQIELKVGLELINDECEDVVITEIKGRWIKLDDGKNIGRNVAAEWRQCWLDRAADDGELPDEESEDGDDEGNEKSMSNTLKKYREGYVHTTNYKGTASMDNGDAVAEALRMLSPSEVCAVADELFGEFVGHHWDKYERLNIGSRRMNAGNRIRAGVKRGDFTVEQVEKATRAWAGNVEAEPELGAE